MSPRIEETDAMAALSAAAPALGAAVVDFMSLAFSGSKVDIVTREMVRIYSGRQSNCQYCSNTRVRGAVERGLDESMVAKIEGFENSDLTDRQKVALRLARSFLIDPARFGSADQQALLAHFRVDQVAELVLDLIRLRPGSKLHIATGMDDGHADLIVI